ncbi:hypothetical protein [Haladaptatus sp. NG-SE-30]
MALVGDFNEPGGIDVEGELFGLCPFLCPARTAFSTLPADVKAEVLDDLDDALLAAADTN